MRLVFDPAALEDLQFWVRTDRRKSERILKLLEAVLRDPFEGPGKPERLRFGRTGQWSRRIDQEHRLVYQVDDDDLIILSCRYHYE
ncbi:MAG: Txe/YoeB family addiction module toxin [Minwuia sp.]|uniref:Txe/YoeB family addiction module toxin n=1 Tax=Minwuia sp. TaxID=2493630 RepID=UPI003A8B76D4